MYCILSTITQREMAFTDDHSRDYLLDPEMWLDKLPQPFQMIDEVLEEFLEEVWVLIKSREATRRQEETQMNIPRVSDGQILSGTDGAAVVSSHGGGPVFVGSPSGLAVFEECSETADELNWRRASLHEWRQSPDSLIVGQNKTVHFVAATFTQEVKIFAYSKELLILLTVVSLTEEQSGGHELTHVSVAPSWTHIAVSSNRHEQGSQLQLFLLPLSSWHSEIGCYLEQADALGGTKSQVSVSSRTSKQHEDIVFSAATLLFGLQPPSPLAPCPATDPAAAMQRLLEDSTATDDLHILSQAYLSNRRKAFVSQRADLVQGSRDAVSYIHSAPSCHYLFYKNSCKQALPCQLVVWWQHHNQLSVYPIPGFTPKHPPPPVNVLTQTAVITRSAVDEDGGMLALGLTNGAVVVWNMITVICVKLLRPMESGDGISAMQFSAGGRLVMGSERGNVNCTALQTATSLEHRLPGQRVYRSESEVVDLKFEPLLLPAVVVSVHTDGTVVLWNSAEREALCKIALPQLVPVGGHSTCTVSKGRLFLICQSETGNSVYAVDLHVTPTLTPHWSTPPTHTTDAATSSGMTASIESYLTQYNKSRRAQINNNNDKWQKRWTELPLVLRQSIPAM